MSSLHNKFSLVPDDVRYLKGQLLESAVLKLNRDLPRFTGAVNDPLRERVTQLLEHFTNEVLESSRHSMIINGVDMATVTSLEKILRDKEDASIEPFDKELNRKLRDLYSQVDIATLQVSELRKKVPEKERKWIEQVSSQRDNVIDRVISSQAGTSLDQTSVELSAEELATLSQLESRYNNLKQKVDLLQTTVPECYTELENLQKTIEFFKSCTA